ncbi:universal stress protein [Arthrobacter agilis]|uniref:universal stress protein n=1 Tax=Arthrobacter agilis TaxID=37921 RepID=UPI000B357FBD|nr:universal stress protein [Arthrobacter agilis]OUM44452.1 hypothetical protein B8W74_03035 [Arthrobacter agilis]PPB47356.1 universal stress protein [Arthrobacter agilis]TPV22854.1 universal stress protein [Arthrobacter agilis]VDR32107.1 Universal stress protein Rv2005c/MT2061 [Arthrobacter agilis]
MTSGTGEPTRDVQRKPIIVGYDGSDDARKAILWAARYAAVADAPLVVVHAWIWPYFTEKLGPVAGIEDSGLRREARRIVAEGHDLAVGAEPGLQVRTHLIIGFPAGMLSRLSAGASLLVVGTRGLGGFAGLLIGSVSFHLAASASCPVVVVRDARPVHDVIVVGVDGSPESERAVGVAGEIAATLRKSVHLLHVRQAQRGRGSRGRAQAAADDAPDVPLEFPGVVVTRESAVASSVPGLIVQRAHAAACVVLGAKGNNTLGARLGSTVHAVLQHAEGNVVVVR